MTMHDRSVRRRVQKLRERLRESPEYGECLRALERRRRRLRWPELDYPWARAFIPIKCGLIGREKGGRPPADRRCTKRLGSRNCWNWREPGSDRCHRHPR